MSIFSSYFSRLHAYRSIDCIIDVSCKIFQNINPFCGLIFCEITLKSRLECPIPPFNNRSLKYYKISDQAAGSYFCSSRHGENLHLIFFNQNFSYKGIFSGELLEVSTWMRYEYWITAWKPSSFPLSEENSVGGWRKLAKIESRALAESSAVLNFNGAV